MPQPVFSAAAPLSVAVYVTGLAVCPTLTRTVWSAVGTTSKPWVAPLEELVLLLVVVNEIIPPFPFPPPFAIDDEVEVEDPPAALPEDDVEGNDVVPLSWVPPLEPQAPMVAAPVREATSAMPKREKLKRMVKRYRERRASARCPTALASSATPVSARRAAAGQPRHAPVPIA
jgi:hypothetical protein